jgi:hypothetical protein
MVSGAAVLSRRRARLAHPVRIVLPVAALVASVILPFAMRIEVLAYPDTFVVMDHGHC